MWRAGLGVVVRVRVFWGGSLSGRQHVRMLSHGMTSVHRVLFHFMEATLPNPVLRTRHRPPLTSGHTVCTPPLAAPKNAN